MDSEGLPLNISRDSATDFAGHEEESCDEVPRHAARRCRKEIRLQSSLKSWVSDSNSDVTRIGEKKLGGLHELVGLRDHWASVQLCGKYAFLKLRGQ